MEARRSDMWQADKELQALTEQLAILTRQYNAAVGGGFKKEAEELKAQVDDTQARVKARQELIPVDPGYAEAIQQIELFIDGTKKNITEDRTRTDDLLARLQKGFTSGAQIAKLPADQQELAKRLEEKLSSINAARQQYNQSLDAGAARATDEALQQQIATLTAGIDARKKQLLDQRGSGATASAEAVKQKQVELDRLKQEQSKAEETYFAASKELENARRAVADARSSFEKLEKLESERTTLQTALKTQNDTLLDKQRELKEAVYPEQPTDADVRVRDGADRRVMFAAIAGGSVFLLFAGLVSMASIRAARFGPAGAGAAPLAPADLRPIQHPHPQPTSNGNGQNAASVPSPAIGPADDDDDRQPAVI
jgi:chromosome segregation ATPase